MIYFFISQPWLFFCNDIFLFLGKQHFNPFSCCFELKFDLRLKGEDFFRSGQLRGGKF